MEPLNDDLLSDYLFELLDLEETAKVEKHLKICPVSRERLEILKRKFRQLELLPEENTSSGVKVFLSAAAAIIIFSYLISSPFLKNPSISTFDSVAQSVEKKSTDNHRALQLQLYAEMEEKFSLLTSMDAPPEVELDLNLPEIKISYEEDYEIVDLKQFVSLKFPDKPDTSPYNNLYANLNLINPTH